MTAIRAGAPLAVLGILVGLSACGSPAPHNALAGLTPSQAVTRAIHQLTTEPYHLEATQTIEMDSTGMSAPSGSGLPAVIDMHQTMTGDFQSPQRFSGVLTTEQHTPVRLVLYNGTAYVSRDGNSWMEAPFLGQISQQFGAASIQSLASQITAVRDTGPVHGLTANAEQYAATVEPSYLTTLTQQMTSSMGPALGIPTALLSKAIAAMHFDSFSLGFDVDRVTGALDSATSSGQVSIDMTQLATDLGAAQKAGVSGVMRLRVSARQGITDRGGRIVVKQPVSNGTMTLQEFASLLSSGATG